MSIYSFSFFGGVGVGCGGSGGVAFQTNVIGLVLLPQHYILDVCDFSTFTRCWVEQMPLFFPCCVMSPSSSPLIFPVSQCFLCAVRRGLLIHLVFLLLVRCHTLQKNEYSVQPPALLQQLTSLLFTVYLSKESLVLGHTGLRCSVFHQVLIFGNELSLKSLF